MADQNSDPMGLVGAGTVTGAAGALRQLIMDRLAAEQRQREAMVQDREFALKQQEAAQRAQEHALNMQTLGDQRTAQAAENRDKMITATTGRLAIGQTLPSAGATASSLPDFLKQDTPLQGQAPPASLAAPGDTGGAQPIQGTVANSVAPGQRTVSYTGTDAQRSSEEKKQGILRLMNDPNVSARERLALQYEQLAGKNAPAGVFDPKPTIDPTATHATNRLFDAAHPLPEKPPPASYQLQPELDATGKQTGRFLGYNTKTNSWEPVRGQGPISTKAAPGAAKTAEVERVKVDALDTLNQLDQAIENAKTLIGPGQGRVSNIEQMIGNPDPRIQALGVKMKAAKMRVDHAVTESVRGAASPVLLQQWDNILANKITPEGLRGGVQAMREIIGGTSGASSGSGIKSITEIKD